MLSLGVISDTHGHIAPEILKIFKGLDFILHAGDIGPMSLLLELEELAPVLAVRGNTDSNSDLKDLEKLKMEQTAIWLTHKFYPELKQQALHDPKTQDFQKLIIYGHTHTPFFQAEADICVLNPGYAGSPKQYQQRSVAIVEINRTITAVSFRYF